MPTYGVGSSLVLVVAGTKIDVDVVSAGVEEGVVVVVVDVMAPNPNLVRKCQFHIVDGVRGRATRSILKRVRMKNRTTIRVPTVVFRASSKANTQENVMGYVRVL